MSIDIGKTAWLLTTLGTGFEVVELKLPRVNPRDLYGTPTVNPDALRMKHAMLDKLYVPTRVELEWFLDHGMLWARMSNGNYWLMRRNGATKLWKRKPDNFRIPFKCGFRMTDALTESDLINTGIPAPFLISETDPNPGKKR